jgi:hypothetical protein
MLFGQSSEHRFSSWLMALCKENDEDILAMGMEIADIGTHSFRKGSATFLSSNPGGPSAISIYLRAGWSLGPVQSRYIFGSEGSDQFVGRAATGLNVNDTTFGVLPPHFNEVDGPVLDLEEWDRILPGYATFYPTEFRAAIPFLLASLVYHCDYLGTTLPRHHPFFLTRVWTEGVLLRLKPKVLSGEIQNSYSGMIGTGCYRKF